jgi:predicted O-methyltransferase YrrM
MPEMTPERWQATQDWLHDVFPDADRHLATLMDDAQARGIPAIAVSSDVGRLLQLLVSSTAGRRAVELGTLAGYSGIWIARGLRPDGALLTVELDEKHAAFAEEQFGKAGVARQVQVRRGAALDVLPRLLAELGPDSVDFLFFDAIKTEYPDYWRLAKPLLKKGGLLVADNVMGAGSWWIDDVGNPSRDAVDRLCRTVAADPEMLATAVPLREGLLIARRRD